MLQIIIRAFWDLKIFLFVLYMLIGIIAICKFIVETSDKDIFQVTFETYQIMFGENTEWVNIDSFPKFFMYIVATNIVNIICLNILISIVTDNYENVQQKIKAIDRKQQAQLLEDNEKIMNNKDAGYPKYLFVISYESGVDDKT